MQTALLEKISQENTRKDPHPDFGIGDTIKVHVRIREGDKQRIQLFTGVVIAKDGGGCTETFTVRRTTSGEGVERIFPVNSPNVTKIEIDREGKVRRAKLYYLRERTGKKARVKAAARR